MEFSDPHGLGYSDVDGDPHALTLVRSMEATAEWPATQRIRAWERQQLGLVEGERLLDVGCGLGDAGIALADDLGSTGELVGVDISETMLQVARRRSVGLPCVARFLVGDAGSLEQPDGSFDAVRSERTLQWLPSPDAVVAGFARVLRPGGRLSLIDTDWSTLCLEVGDAQITRAVREGLRVERDRPSNVGRRLTDLVEEAGLAVKATTAENHTWTRWNPDDTPTPSGCFSMTSLAEDLVERGQLRAGDVTRFVETIHDAARRQRFEMSLTVHAVVAVAP